jgi:hypothetical protein
MGSPFAQREGLTLRNAGLLLARLDAPEATPPENSPDA